MDKKQYSIFLLKGWSALLKELINYAEANSDVLNIVEKKGTGLRIEDKDSHFFFKVYNPNQKDNKVYVEIDRAPRNRNITANARDNFETTTTFEAFKNWVAIIREYESTCLLPEDEFQKQYEDEFFHEFDVVDEDAGTTAYDLKRQLFLYKYLEYVQDVFNKHAPEVEKAELIEEAKQLQSNLANLSKKATIKALSKILSKARKAGINLIKLIWEEGKKEALKQVIKYGFDNLDTFLHTHHIIS